MTRPPSLVRAASVLGSWTLVSRVLGYARDSLNAGLFGAGTVADAYFVAFRIPNLLRDLVAEGALSAAVIPAISRRCAPGRDGTRARGDAARLVSALLTWVGLGGGVLVLLGGLAAPWIVHLMAPGFLGTGTKFALTVSLTRWLFPFILCMSLAAVVQAWLTAQERFGPQAFGPVALNACVIVAGLAILVRGRDAPEHEIYLWSAGVLAGGLAQWLVQVPAARRAGLHFRWRWWHPGLADIGSLMVPALIGFSITQIYLLVNTILASFLPEGSVARIYYGNRLMQLPLGAIGVAISTVTYPVVARAFQARRPAEAAAALNRAVRLAAFAVLPAAAGLIALAPQINALLFRYGRFTAADAAITAAVSSAYAVGIFGHVMNRVLAPAFYAAGRPWVPVAIDGVGVAANVLVSTLLMFRIGVVGLPLSTSLVTLATAGWLAWRLTPLAPGFGRGLGGSLGRSFGAALLMGLVVWGGMHAAVAAWPDLAGTAKGFEALATAGGILLGFAIYAGLARLLDHGEWREVRAALKEKG